MEADIKTNNNDDIITFDEIWNTMTVDQELEDEFAKFLSSNSQIKTVKESYTKLVEGHICNIKKWRYKDYSAFESNDLVQNINKIYEQSQMTNDVTEAKALFSQSAQILNQTKENTIEENQLLLHWNELFKIVNDVNIGSRNYIMDLSIQLNDLGSRLEDALLLYQSREGEIFLKAKETLQKIMTTKFQAYRISKLINIQKIIQEKYAEETNKEICKYQKKKEQRIRENNEIDNLRTDVSQLKIELSKDPLIRHHRLTVIEEKLLQKEKKLTSLKVKLARIKELEIKRRIERQERQMLEKAQDKIQDNNEKPKNKTVRH